MRELELLKHIYAQNAALPGGVTLGPGDDMGAVRVDSGQVLVTVDQLADGVHVDVANTAIERVGRKAITRNLSDVAAMAALPIGAVAAASLPRDFGQAKAEALFDAMRSTAAGYGCPLFGGDISMWDGPMLLTVTVLAEAKGIEPVTRAGSEAGDGIYVTGSLGNSLAGHHLDFEPRLGVARALAGDVATRPRAMLDVSDGVAQDLPRLCYHAEVWADHLPIREGTAEPRWKHALSDGEDYELLFTAPPSAAIPESIEGVAITKIGEVKASGGVVAVLADGERVDVAGLGWEHRG